MPRRSKKPPENATPLTLYSELEELLTAFAGGKIGLLIILGRPGLAKSETVKAAVQGKDALVVGGRKSPLDLYTDLYHHRDTPIVLNDADRLLEEKDGRELVRALTETSDPKQLTWGTKTRILDDEGIPRRFWTRSSVCIITNWWASDHPVFEALESRGEFVRFDPSWSEVYKQAARWFWDQEIYDYIHGRLSDLRQPDCRLLVKAANRKKAGLELMDWRRIIDEYVDDAVGLTVRRLLDDQTFLTNVARVKAFEEMTGYDRATFYRRMRDLERYRPAEKVPRLLLADYQPTSGPSPACREASTASQACLPTSRTRGETALLLSDGDGVN